MLPRENRTLWSNCPVTLRNVTSSIRCHGVPRYCSIALLATNIVNTSASDIGICGKFGTDLVK